MKTFAEWMNYRRTELGVQMKDVAQKANTAASSLSLIEEGTIAPTLGLAVDIMASIQSDAIDYQ